MGLDTTHDCWHGAYSAFNRWRTIIAKEAGFPPLDLMEGFCKINGIFDDSDIKEISQALGSVMWENTQVSNMCKVMMAYYNSEIEFPIKWDKYRDDPLTHLLDHSDCGGELESSVCGPIADRLEGLLPVLKTRVDDFGHIGNWVEKTQAFIDGLREASRRNENVEFH